MLNLLNDQSSSFKRLIAIIDGEHYPQITFDAIEVLKKEFPGEFCGIIFLGGTEKITTGNFTDFFNDKVFVIKNFLTDFPAALDRFKPDLVYDLSDEPVVNYRIRMTIASFCFFKKASYMGPDFLFKYEKKLYETKNPSISIIGTGKRIGKTAISSFIARLFKKNALDVLIVAMGRGGPKDPQLLRGEEINISPQYLLSLSSKGLHASSDYIEDAMMSRITTIGCRRCGGGFGGKVFLSNVSEGAKLADSLNPDVIILEGSGASVPEVQTFKTICVVGANQNWDEITGYLGIYRILVSDLVILTNCEKPLATREEINNLENNIKTINPSINIYRSIFRPEPLGNIENKKVVVAMTAKSIIEDKIKKYIEKKFNCTVVGITFNLSNRPLLKKDLESYTDYDTVLTELKAASVDVVTDFALKSGKEIIYMNNICEILSGSKTFEKNLLQLYGSIKK
ncbi:MAG: 2,3-diphosphoglycerate synthetase [Actinobacteria bacterium]|nr:2,3-diphosphoglycerate synthetase [Actinomycetota bacterium]